MPDTRNRFRGECLDIPLIHNRIDTFMNTLEKMGFPSFEVRIQELIALGDIDTINFLKSKKGFINFTNYNNAWNRTDFYDELGTRLARLNDAEFNFFFRNYLKSKSEKEELLNHVVSYLNDKTNKYIPEHTFEIKGIEIPVSANGIGPDYRLATDQVYPNNGLWFNNDLKSVSNRIQLSGTRADDETRAFAALGNFAAAEKEDILGLYVWHHLDDFDPADSSVTMQLVLKEFHNPIKKLYEAVPSELDPFTRRYIPLFKHIGGVKVYEDFYFVKYK